MASWKDAPGQYLWGTYSNIGNYYKIYAFGGPGGGDSDYFYVPSEEMDRLRSKNYGTGIHFWWDGDRLKITINLIIVSAKGDYQYVQGDNVHYVGGSDLDYEFLANIQYQTTDGTWHKLGDHSINMHHGGQPLYPASGWDSGSGYLWNTFTFININTDKIKQFSVGIHGASDEVGNWVYYPIKKVKPTTPTPRPQPRPVNRTLTLKYVDRATGRSIKRDTTQSVEDGKLYRLTPAELVRYTAEETSAQIRINGDTEYTFYYTKNVEYANVIVEYIDRATGNSLSKARTLRNKVVGSTITEYALVFDGYSVEHDTINHIVLNGSFGNIIRFYYTRNIEYIKPWAIRKSGVWKSFTTNGTNMVKRVRGAWSKKDTSMDSRLAGGNKTTNDTAGNKSASYIRKNDSWKRQGKIGN